MNRADPKIADMTPDAYLDDAEVWRPCLDNYEVSNMGRVRRTKPGKNTHVGKILKAGLASMGYLTVAPVVGGKNVTHYVHELVAAAFIGPRPAGMLVNHKDTIKLNNRDSNLEYITFAGNMAHAADAGVLSHGIEHYNAKMTDETVRALRADRAAGISYSKLAAKYGVVVSHAWQIVNGSAWRHVQ